MGSNSNNKPVLKSSIQGNKNKTSKQPIKLQNVSSRPKRKVIENPKYPADTFIKNDSEGRKRKLLRDAIVKFKEVESAKKTTDHTSIENQKKLDGSKKATDRVPANKCYADIGLQVSMGQMDNRPTKDTAVQVSLGHCDDLKQRIERRNKTIQIFRNKLAYKNEELKKKDQLITASRMELSVPREIYPVQSCLFNNPGHPLQYSNHHCCQNFHPGAPLPMATNSFRNHRNHQSNYNRNY